MSDRMTPIPFSGLVGWMMEEYQKNGTIFGVGHPYQAKENMIRSIFGRKLETPVGPAAGPHTQLAQNIAASYYTGSRFFELKTVQILDGEDLPVAKPCIIAEDECYNCEWSTELYVPQARDEYIKAWFLLHILAKEFDLGAADGFQFNMSVGYDLEGIKSAKIDTFIESMKDAGDTDCYQECRAYLLKHLDRFQKLTREDVLNISPQICNSVTLSTLHGCPPQEIERIAVYLMEEKGLHTFIKCNPTLLGYEFARKTMDRMGYDYVAFGDFHFLDDLQYEDAIPMLKRLIEAAGRKSLEFGVKITNTFPVDVKQQELPSEEMYMSGKSLYPLSVSLAAKLSREFGGTLRISYSGGADYFNIRPMVEAGVWPVTVATTLLKPGGYQRLNQLAAVTEQQGAVFNGINVQALEQIAGEAINHEHHVKAVKPLPSRKIEARVPLTDCYIAPCESGCPIHQDIPAYIELTEQGRYEEALEVIIEKNPLPFITGTICAHNCMSKCTRNFYEDPVYIRQMKLIAAENGFDQLIGKLHRPAASTGQKVAVVGGGAAGMSAAFFLARGGAEVTLFEREKELGGIVRNVVPEFRIPGRMIDRDAELLRAVGVEVKTGTTVDHVDELKAQGYGHIVLGLGASEKGRLTLESGETTNAIDFLTSYRAADGNLDLGRSVVVIGGGNTAMDTARAARRVKGVEHVYLVYRRTKRYMPADEEELVLAMEDGVEFKELLAPVSLENGMLTCRVMELSEMDGSGRRGVAETNQEVKIPADLVIAAVGEKVPSAYYQKNGLDITGRGTAVVDSATLESSRKGVYIAGDGLNGPATVVEAIRDAKLIAEAILKKAIGAGRNPAISDEEIYARKGILAVCSEEKEEGKRCLACSSICENCTEVCPNRANIRIGAGPDRKHQIIHVDYMCNECGNCKSFCPYSSAPYLDKFTLFANEKDMADSKNEGFVIIDGSSGIAKVRLDGREFEYDCSAGSSKVPVKIGEMITAVWKDYEYLWK